MTRKPKQRRLLPGPKPPGVEARQGPPVEILAVLLLNYVLREAKDGVFKRNDQRAGEHLEAHRHRIARLIEAWKERGWLKVITAAVKRQDVRGHWYQESPEILQVILPMSERRTPAWLHRWPSLGHL